jgi:hypothetical protein
MRPIRLLASLVLGLSIAATARGERPADVLLRLVPADAGATLAIEDLRIHAPEFTDSPLAAGLKKLPVVQDWLASDRYRKFQHAQEEIETALDVPLGTLRDQLLGDAVVLALQLAPDDTPDRASGLFLVRFRSRALLDRVIERLNEAEKQDGVLVNVTACGVPQSPYWARNFRPGTKPVEYYAIAGDEVFAWSNSEEVIQGVLARKSGAPGLGDDPRFRKVRDSLPEHAFVSLFVNPRYIERMRAAETKPQTPAEQRVSALLERNFAAVEYAGAALEWRDGFLLQTHETIDPAKLDVSLRQWADRPGRTTSALVERVPRSALALAAGRIDLSALFDAWTSLVPEADRLQRENSLTVVRGLLMGKDLRQDVLPFLGPGFLVYADAPVSAAGTDARVPLVLMVNLSAENEERGVASAIDNALRTVMAIYASDPKRREARLRVESHEERGVRLTTLAGAQTLCAYAIENGTLVLSTSGEAVVACCAEQGQGQGGLSSRFALFRAAFFPEAESFAFVDLPRLYEAADAHREGLARSLAAKHNRPADAARRDLDQALDLIQLFQGAFATSSINPGFTAIHRSIGLVARDPAPAPLPAAAPGR